MGKKGRLVQGIGVNDVDHPIQSTINGKITRCPFYQAWVGMFKRCYSSAPNKKCHAYDGVTVAPEWHRFSIFRAWMMTQNWKGKSLDKDIMYPGNNVYSPESCVFVSKRINSLIRKTNASLQGLPVGAHFSGTKGKYVSQTRINGADKHLGTFDTKEEASNVYKEHKRLQLLKLACCEPEIRVKQGLYRHSELLRTTA